MQHDIRWADDGDYTRAFIDGREVAWIYTGGSTVSYWARGPVTVGPSSSAESIHRARFRCRKGVADNPADATVKVERLLSQMWNEHTGP